MQSKQRKKIMKTRVENMRKINETKIFFEVNKIDKPLARLIKKNKKRRHKLLIL